MILRALYTLPNFCFLFFVFRGLNDRFHQIRRHLNGLSHPVVGDSVHGSSPFNREVVRDYGAPPGRLMLHCLRLSLPTLPGPASGAWSAGELVVTVRGDNRAGELERTVGEDSRTRETVCSDDVDSLIAARSRRNKGGKEERGHGAKDTEGIGRGFNTDDDEGVMSGVGGGVGRANSGVAGGGGDDVLRSRFEQTIRGPARMGNSEIIMFGKDPLSPPPPQIVGGRAIDGVGGEIDSRGEIVEQARIGTGEGLEIYCPPPDDMMDFLRGMSWWGEGLIQAASGG